MSTTPTQIPTSPRPDDTAARLESEPAYLGEWTPLGRTVVIVDGERCQPLPLRDSAQIGGYAWGRGGAVPREVARAILIDATGNPMLAERLCRPMTWEIVSALPSGGFRLTRTEVLDWVGAQPSGLNL